MEYPTCPAHPPEVVALDQAFHSITPLSLLNATLILMAIHTLITHVRRDFRALHTIYPHESTTETFEEEKPAVMSTAGPSGAAATAYEWGGCHTGPI